VSERIPVGKIEVPEGWEVSTELKLIQPAAKDQSRAAITVSRYASMTDPSPALTSFLNQLQQHAPSMKRAGDGEAVFEDGGRGAYAIVRYEVQPGRSVAQCHVFRRDGDTTSHLTATVEGTDADRLGGELLAVLSTFSPV
jgi:hypothetical protein